MHQVEPLHIRLRHRCGLDRARIVDDDIERAERRRRLVERLFHRAFVADIDGERQGAAAGLFDLFGGGEDRAFKLGVRFDRFRGDGDIGAVTRGGERDRQSDAA
jgi:hypothetical protein